MVFPKKSAATPWSTECSQSNLKIRFDTPCTLKMGEIFLPSSFCLCMNSKVLSRWCLHSAVVSASATCRQEGNSLNAQLSGYGMNIEFDEKQEMQSLCSNRWWIPIGDV